MRDVFGDKAAQFVRMSLSKNSKICDGRSQVRGFIAPLFLAKLNWLAVTSDRTSAHEICVQVTD